MRSPFKRNPARERPALTNERLVSDDFLRAKGRDGAGDSFVGWCLVGQAQFVAAQPSTRYSGSGETTPMIKLTSAFDPGATARKLITASVAPASITHPHQRAWIRRTSGAFLAGAGNMTTFITPRANAEDHAGYRHQDDANEPRQSTQAPACAYISRQRQHRADHADDRSMQY